jgi:hypothetical protein
MLITNLRASGQTCRQFLNGRNRYGQGGDRRPDSNHKMTQKKHNSFREHQDSNKGES